MVAHVERSLRFGDALDLALLRDGEPARQAPLGGPSNFEIGLAAVERLVTADDLEVIVGRPTAQLTQRTGGCAFRGGGGGEKQAGTASTTIGAMVLNMRRAWARRDRPVKARRSELCEKAAAEGAPLRGSGRSAWERKVF